MDALLGGAEPRPAAPLELDGWVVVWRPLDSRDVAAAAEAGDAAAAEHVLLARCVESARGPNGAVDGPALPPVVREALVRAMAEADPLAEVLVDLACPACETTFVADLDLGAFVWAELSARARRLLREVDVLARAYGWTEAEVLALGERTARRLPRACERGRPRERLPRADRGAGGRRGAGRAASRCRRRFEGLGGEVGIEIVEAEAPAADGAAPGRGVARGCRPRDALRRAGGLAGRPASRARGAGPSRAADPRHAEAGQARAARLVR